MRRSPGGRGPVRGSWRALAAILAHAYNARVITGPRTSRSTCCSAATLDVLRRVREVVEVVPVSYMLAFAVLQLHWG